MQRRRKSLGRKRTARANSSKIAKPQKRSYRKSRAIAKRSATSKKKTLYKPLGKFNPQPKSAREIEITLGRDNLSSSSSAPTLNVSFIGGIGRMNANDASLEAYTSLLSPYYFLRGYMLQFSTPPIQPGSIVTWTVLKRGSPAGTFYSGGAWTDYQNSLPSNPQTQVVYWRSDMGAANVSEVYEVSAKYTPLNTSSEITITVQLQTRLITKGGDFSTKYNSDVDMLQRAMIQVFALNQGRLNNYNIGYYQDNSGNQFYTTKAGNPFSRIADEVWNFQYYSMNLGTEADYNVDLVFTEWLWNQFGLILSTGAIGAVSNTNSSYNSWVSNAISTSGYAAPSGFTKTSGDVLKGLHIAESSGVHSITPIQPLACNNIKIGDPSVKKGRPGFHYFTDFGLGFAQVQPYNADQGAGTYNLYKPDENIIAGAYILKFYQSQTSSIPGPNAKVWHAIYGYNSGNVQAGQNPIDLRPSGPAKDADNAFRGMGLTPPDYNTQ